MKIKDIVEETALLLQIEDVLALPEFASSTYANVNPKIAVGPLTERTLNLLVRCVNYAMRLIATSYLPQKTSQAISTENGEIKFELLNFDCLEVTKIESAVGEVAFKTYPTFVDIFKSGDYEVFYNFVPSVKQLDDCVEDFSSQIKKEIVAYLAAAEYCSISSLDSEANMWEAKFKDAMRRILKTKSKTVKERRWW